LQAALNELKKNSRGSY